MLANACGPCIGQWKRYVVFTCIYTGSSLSRHFTWSCFIRESLPNVYAVVILLHIKVKVI